MRRDPEPETIIAVKFSAVVDALDERGRRLWAAAESDAIGYGGDSLVSDATGLSRDTIRVGRQQIHSGENKSDKRPFLQIQRVSPDDQTFGDLRFDAVLAGSARLSREKSRASA